MTYFFQYLILLKKIKFMGTITLQFRPIRNYCNRNCVPCSVAVAAFDFVQFEFDH